MEAGLRARDVVRQLLNFSRRIDSRKDPVDLRTVVREAMKLLTASIPSNISVRAMVPDHLPAVMADATQIHQVLINLCNNGAQAMPDGGMMTVELSLAEPEGDEVPVANESGGSPGPWIRLTVRDTGAGIPKDNLNRIFDPYFTTKAVGKGTGMGLAVVHGIVRDHGGVIRVRSIEGEGTAFEVYLPVTTADVPVDVPAVGTPAEGRETLLFVDDEPGIVALNRQILERLGYRVLTATDPRKALEIFRDRPMAVDLVISDMTMPHMTGDQLAQALLDIRPDLPIIVCTGFSERMSPERAKAIGIREVLMKPVSKKMLGDMIRTILDQETPEPPRTYPI
jgi:CheY-like chemotaxis protein